MIDFLCNELKPYKVVREQQAQLTRSLHTASLPVLHPHRGVELGVGESQIDVPPEEPRIGVVL